jgi:serine O-acetyltransferase
MSRSPEPPKVERAPPPQLSAWTLLRSDVEHCQRQSEAFQSNRASLRKTISVLLTPSLLCCALHRLAHAAHLRRWGTVSRLLARLNVLLHRAVLDPQATVGPGLYIPHPVGVVFRGNAGRNLVLYAGAIVGPLAPLPFPSGGEYECPSLGDDVTVGMNAMILGPAIVGHGARIGPGTIVTKLVKPGMTIIAGQLLARAGKDAAPPITAPVSNSSL